MFGAGLGVLADVTGSAVLVWRFRAARRQAPHSAVAEVRAAVVVAVALAVVSAVLVSRSLAALVNGSHPGTSAMAAAAAGVSRVVLAPLAHARGRLGRRMGGRALRGNGALSGIGAATSLLALAALVPDHALGWWWAGRATALIIAVAAAAAGWQTLPRHRHQRR